MGRWARCLLLATVTTSVPGATAAPLPGAVEADAQEYTRLAMRHDQLLLKANLRQISPAEQEEMRRLGASGEAIKARYAPGRVAPALAAGFSKRLQELSREVIAPARKKWVVDAFPEPDAVAAAFPDDLEQAAAMQVLARTLTDKLGQPPIPEQAAKIARYQAAWARINPHARADYGARLDRIDGLRRSKQFTVQVLERFLPVYATEAGNALRKERFETATVSDVERYLSAVLAMVGLLTALPLLFLTVGEGRRRRETAAGTGGVKPFHLPPELEEVRVFRKRYPVTFRAGKVTGVSTSKTKEEVSTYVPGDGTPFKAPEYRKVTHTHTETRFTLEGTDGYKTELTLQPLDFPPEEGELYSILLSRKILVICHNHSADFFHPREEGIRDANRMRGFPLWLCCLAVSAVGFLAIDHFLNLGTAAESAYRSANLRAMIVLTVPVTGLYIGLLKLAMRLIRVRQFNAHWTPRFRQFMEAQTQPLQAHFATRAERVATGAASTSRPRYDGS